MNRLPFIFLLAWGVVSLGTPVTVHAADSKDNKQKADPKKKEAEKKDAEKKEPEKKVYTNDDLKKARGDSVLFLGPAAVAPPLSGLGDNPAGDEQSWRGRAGAARKAITDAETKVKDLEARLVGIRNDMKPNEGTLDPNRQQNREAEQGKIKDELDSAKAGVAAAKKSLDDLEEEARRKSVPPGWLREP